MKIIAKNQEELMKLRKDEMCTCTHLMSQHSPQTGKYPGLDGHGSCELCDCGKFTWKYWTDEHGNEVDLEW